MIFESQTKTLLPVEVSVKRSDPVYNAHGYLTKVPVAAIEPFILALSEPGDVVLDVFAGSGMTGIAAAIHDRRAELRDISHLGRHIGRNYLNLVDASELRAAADRAVAAATRRVGRVYATACERCGQPAELSRTTWSVVYACPECGGHVGYYHAFEHADWQKQAIACPACHAPLKTRGARRVGEQPVIDTIACACSTALRDQPARAALVEPSLDGLTWPDQVIGQDRQMYAASALARNELTTTASFFSPRNLAALAALRQAIGDTTSDPIRQKLLFAFTAILARASKRYQWSRKRPLNAANQHYYIAPVFLEWNVFDLYTRKVNAVIRSDQYIHARMGGPLFAGQPQVSYQIGSADHLDLPDKSVDYVFTDPPFGSNIFYSDMNLFQEAWLGEITDHHHEAVVDRTQNGHQHRTAHRYEQLITDSLRECHRVLKPGAHLSLVFSNSDGKIWALLQRAIRTAGFVIEPEGIALLDKGQRSIKGLASGVENTVTIDLILTMRMVDDDPTTPITPAPTGELERSVMAALDQSHTPSHVYAAVIRHYLQHHWDVTNTSIEAVVKVIRATGLDIDAATGHLHQPA